MVILYIHSWGKSVLQWFFKTKLEVSAYRKVLLEPIFVVLVVLLKTAMVPPRFLNGLLDK